MIVPCTAKLDIFAASEVVDDAGMIIIFLWTHLDSNQGLLSCEDSALTS